MWQRRNLRLRSSDSKAHDLSVISRYHFLLRFIFPVSDKLPLIPILPSVIFLALPKSFVCTCAYITCMPLGSCSYVSVRIHICLHIFTCKPPCFYVRVFCCLQRRVQVPLLLTSLRLSVLRRLMASIVCQLLSREFGSCDQGYFPTAGIF